MTFEETWNAIQAGLATGTKIRNWTAANGYLGDTVTISDVSSGRVVVSPPAADSEQSVSKKEFEKVHAVWAGYCSGVVQRHKIRDMTRFSKYIISILHHIGA